VRYLSSAPPLVCATEILRHAPLGRN
jgi:hypothetical protein